MNWRLKGAISMKGFKQYEVADKVGITETTLSKIVSGRRPVSKELRQALANVLEKPEHELFNIDVKN